MKIFNIDMHVCKFCVSALTPRVEVILQLQCDKFQKMIHCILWVQILLLKQCINILTPH